MDPLRIDIFIFISYYVVCPSSAQCSVCEWECLCIAYGIRCQNICDIVSRLRRAAFFLHLSFLYWSALRTALTACAGWFLSDDILACCLKEKVKVTNIFFQKRTQPNNRQYWALHESANCLWLSIKWQKNWLSIPCTYRMNFSSCHKSISKRFEGFARQQIASKKFIRIEKISSS